MRRTTKRYGASVQRNENVLKLLVVVAAQFCDNTKDHCIICIVCIIMHYAVWYANQISIRLSYCGGMDGQKGCVESG